MIKYDITDPTLLQERLQHLHVLLNVLPGGICFKDANGRWIEVNDNIISIFGLEGIDYKGKTDKELSEVLPSMKEAFELCIKSDMLVWESGRHIVTEEEFNYSNGQKKIFEVSKTPLYEKDGSRYGLIIYALDVTEKKMLYENLNKKVNENRALFEAIPDTIFTMSTEGYLLNCNIGSEYLSIMGEIDVRGKHISEILPERYAKMFMECLERVVNLGNVHTFEYDMDLSDNLEELSYFEARVVPCDEHEVLVIVREITESKKMYEKLKRLSLYDALTQLYNRAYFEQEMKRRSIGRFSPVIILICDVDGLKVVNDILGHMAGDKLLCEVANILRQSTRAEDMVARIGGDEFAILLAESDSQVGEKIYDRINNVERFVEIEDLQWPVSVSVGIAVRDNKERLLNDVFKQADVNMYKDKMKKRAVMRRKTMKALLSTLPVKDYDADGHSERLRMYMAKISEMLGIDERLKQQYVLFAKYHDIGKALLPEGLFLKADKLNTEEMLKIRQHSELGYRVAQFIPELKVIADWILKHHEWWDGTGYPHGVSGVEIPLPCRIFSVIDAYDVMLQKRPYRKPFTQKDAINELEKCAGTQFDPDVVRLMQKCIKGE